MIKCVLRFAIYAIYIGLIVWMLASWIDVLMHNDPLTGNRGYMPANAFVVMTQISR